MGTNVSVGSIPQGSCTDHLQGYDTANWAVTINSIGPAFTGSGILKIRLVGEGSCNRGSERPGSDPGLVGVVVRDVESESANNSIAPEMASLDCSVVVLLLQLSANGGLEMYGTDEQILEYEKAESVRESLVPPTMILHFSGWAGT
jgi:hypothetical protein